MRPISLPPSTCCLALRHLSMTAAINVLNSMKNLSILGRPISLDQYTRHGIVLPAVGAGTQKPQADKREVPKPMLSVPPQAKLSNTSQSPISDGYNPGRCVPPMDISAHQP